MAKIRISSKGGKMTFSLSPNNRTIDNNLNLTQTNIINTDSMIFTSNYILKNPEIISTFIQGIALQRNINKVFIKDKEIVSLVLLTIQNINQFEEVHILPDEPVSFEEYERLLYSPYIKYVSCYSMKHFMIEKLDKNNIVVEVRKEMFFLSNFMNDNDMKYYSSIYYKRTIKINNNMTSEDLEDFEIFCRINKYVKVIDLHYFSLEVIRNIIRLLIKYNIKNVKFNLFENKENTQFLIESIEYLKLMQAETKQKNNLTFKIIYSSEYKQKNIVKQINLTNIKISSILIIIALTFGLLIQEYHGYVSEQNIKEINDALEKEVLKLTDKMSSSDTPSSNVINNVDNPEEEIEPIDSTKAYNEAFRDIFSLLQSKNEDTVGWIKVNNTAIEFPVVQAKDNDYYLTRDFNKKRNSLGWIFMDYRNNAKNLDQNTIIYGHNSSRKKDAMFTHLAKVLEQDWSSNKTNQIITFNTPYENMEWQIFSVYDIHVTSDYLYTNFDLDKDFLKFANKLKNRSAFNFNVELNEKDKILTLSSCLNRGLRRVVVHAKLTKIIPNLPK